MQAGMQEVPPKHQGALLYCPGDQTVPQVAQRDCGVLLLGDLQKPSGHGGGQPSLGVCA